MVLVLVFPFQVIRQIWCKSWHINLTSHNLKIAANFKLIEGNLIKPLSWYPASANTIEWSLICCIANLIKMLHSSFPSGYCYYYYRYRYYHSIHIYSRKFRLPTSLAPMFMRLCTVVGIFLPHIPWVCKFFTFFNNDQKL